MLFPTSSRDIPSSSLPQKKSVGNGKTVPPPKKNIGFKSTNQRFTIPNEYIVTIYIASSRVHSSSSYLESQVPYF